jgi:hypothetical protein
VKNGIAHHATLPDPSFAHFKLGFDQGHDEGVIR